MINGKRNEVTDLATLRTLLALERNCLAEKRTHLAQIRTGLALALFGPPTNIIFYYSNYSIEIPLFVNILITLLILSITTYGIILILHGRKKLQIVNCKIDSVKEKEILLIEQAGLDDIINNCFK